MGPMEGGGGGGEGEINTKMHRPTDSVAVMWIKLGLQKVKF